jgi:hypothetical protein
VQIAPVGACAQRTARDFLRQFPRTQTFAEDAIAQDAIE